MNSLEERIIACGQHMASERSFEGSLMIMNLGLLGIWEVPTSKGSRSTC